ncbi:MAG: DegV family protein [Candidatus Heimdallarchaeaceae archaeon]|jgi:DegV family protein with EDD domain
MNKYVVITDSGADLSDELIQKYNINIMPFSVILPDTNEVLQERKDITNEEYYERVISAKKHPTTSQPNPNDMLQVIKKIDSEDLEGILYITMASSITGTYNTAHLAKKLYEKEGGKARIEIFDSYQASMAVGVQAIKASILFQQGKNIEEVIEELNYFKLNELKSTLTVETLKYLMKGGRVSKFRYAVGSLLNLTPCLEGTYEGKLEGFTAVRSYEDAIKEIINHAFKEIKAKENLAVYITAGKAEKGINLAKNYLSDNYPETKIIDVLQIGSAIFTHTGPGVIAIILFKDFQH